MRMEKVKEIGAHICVDGVNPDKMRPLSSFGQKMTEICRFFRGMLLDTLQDFRGTFSQFLTKSAQQGLILSSLTPFTRMCTPIF